MKILYDYKIFYQQNAGGVSNYIYNLGIEMLKLNYDIKIYSPIHKNLYLKKSVIKQIRIIFFRNYLLLVSSFMKV